MNTLFILSVVVLSSTLVSSAGKIGKTTRYWDCCKASCAWAHKGPLVREPVKSCAKDGVTVMGIHDTSGCGGGTSYMCNNQQPYVVNASLSLGFAAAHLAGQDEGDWCCGCYELTFTDAPVSGKKFVVQVTNTGGDLGNNHFDLEIPGGGVGIFGQGCKTQWGAPDDGWGVRYGGVSADSECATLPKPLQEGCHWRFGWFANANNPAMTFQRVQCPKSLIARTNCDRSDESTVANKAYVNL